ncbi:hypothetical protein [Bacillus haynesii]|uniref:hypothetical protein n=1 Tax=Bacillus haynesii TaxID=1925021 RepID=UPI00227E2C78|nr:hypothetical protein [Bacillus haynesii]MCY8754790.1 hypothetical protein [Bacillus haynesii]
MARLEGVKTLDMVNGKKTKVLYDGVEYVRVGGEGQPGDIGLRISNPTTYVSLGHFYPIIYVRGLMYIDDDGDLMGVPPGTFSFFRKVAASQPSLEDRVSTNEKDIETLKSDVAALKGEAGPEYVRIDKGEAKVGDFIKYIVTVSPSVKIGRLYEISGLRSGRHFAHIDEDGDRVRTEPNEVFEVYRKVSAAEPKPERLKVGDYAKVVGGARDHQAEINDIVQVTFDDDGTLPFRCDDINGKSIGWFYEAELVLATDEEVAEAKGAVEFAKFKEGAKVRLKSGGGETPLYGFENGKVYTVVDNDYTHGCVEKKIQIECDWYFGYATPDQLEIVSEEEAAEIEKWAAIGREVGEYKVGDVVSYDDPICFENSGIGEVEGFGDRGNPEVNSINYNGHKTSYILTPDRLKLVAPVEVRFDRKGDE